MTDQPYLELDPLSDTFHFHQGSMDIEVGVEEHIMLGVAPWAESDFDRCNTLTKIRATQETE